MPAQASNSHSVRGRSASFSDLTQVPSVPTAQGGHRHSIVVGTTVSHVSHAVLGNTVPEVTMEDVRPEEYAAPHFHVPGYAPPARPELAVEQPFFFLPARTFMDSDESVEVKGKGKQPVCEQPSDDKVANVDTDDGEFGATTPKAVASSGAQQGDGDDETEFGLQLRRFDWGLRRSYHDAVTYVNRLSIGLPPVSFPQTPSPEVPPRPDRNPSPFGVQSLNRRHSLMPEWTSPVPAESSPDKESRRAEEVAMLQRRHALRFPFPALIISAGDNIGLAASDGEVQIAKEAAAAPAQMANMDETEMDSETTPKAFMGHPMTVPFPDVATSPTADAPGPAASTATMALSPRGRQRSGAISQAAVPTILPRPRNRMGQLAGNVLNLGRHVLPPQGEQTTTAVKADSPTRRFSLRESSPIRALRRHASRPLSVLLAPSETEDATTTTATERPRLSRHKSMLLSISKAMSKQHEAAASWPVGFQSVVFPQPVSAPQSAPAEASNIVHGPLATVETNVVGDARTAPLQSSRNTVPIVPTPPPGELLSAEDNGLPVCRSVAAYPRPREVFPLPDDPTGRFKIPGSWAGPPPQLTKEELEELFLSAGLPMTGDDESDEEAGHQDEDEDDAHQNENVGHQDEDEPLPPLPPAPRLAHATLPPSMSAPVLPGHREVPLVAFSTPEHHNDNRRWGMLLPKGYSSNRGGINLPPALHPARNVQVSSSNGNGGNGISNDMGTGDNDLFVGNARILMPGEIPPRAPPTVAMTNTTVHATTRMMIARPSTRPRDASGNILPGPGMTIEQMEQTRTPEQTTPTRAPGRRLRSGTIANAMSERTPLLPAPTATTTATAATEDEPLVPLTAATTTLTAVLASMDAAATTTTATAVASPAVTDPPAPVCPPVAAPVPAPRRLSRAENAISTDGAGWVSSARSAPIAIPAPRQSLSGPLGSHIAAQRESARQTLDREHQEDADAEIGVPLGGVWRVFLSTLNLDSNLHPSEVNQVVRDHFVFKVGPRGQGYLDDEMRGGGGGNDGDDDEEDLYHY